MAKPDIQQTEASRIKMFLLKEARITMLSGIVGEHGVPLFTAGKDSFYLSFCISLYQTFPTLKVSTNAKKGIKKGTVIRIYFDDDSSLWVKLRNGGVNFGTHKEFFTTFEMVSMLSLADKLIDHVTIEDTETKQAVYFNFADCDFYTGKQDGQKLMQIMVQRLLGFLPGGINSQSQNTEQLPQLDALLTILK